MAQKGKGKRVRFQNGTLFPAVMAAVLVLGVGLIAYARSLQGDNDVRPRAQILAEQSAGSFDHWHVALGFYNCDTWLPNVSGDGESLPSLSADSTYRGVHSHDDGVVHYHPFDTAVSGRRANLNKYLETYGIKVSKDRIEFPAAQGGTVLDVDDTKCGDKKAKIETWVWQDATKTDARFLTANPGNVRIGVDGMAIGIFFVPEDFGADDVVEPPTASQLAVLGAEDGGAAPAVTTDSTVAGSTPDSGVSSESTTPVSVAGESTAPAASTPATVPASAAPDTTG